MGAGRGQEAVGLTLPRRELKARQGCPEVPQEERTTHPKDRRHDESTVGGSQRCWRCRSCRRAVSSSRKQWWAKWRLSTLDLYPWGKGHGVQGQICDILAETPASYESLPAPLATQIPTLWIHTSGGRGLGGGGALILDRCRAFDLFASVDAHLCPQDIGGSRDRSRGREAGTAAPAWLHGEAWDVIKRKAPSQDGRNQRVHIG
jgi:hypothetical protein